MGSMVLTGCGGGEKATTGSTSTTTEATATAAKVSAQTFSGSQAILVALQAGGVNCVQDMIAAPGAQSQRCNVDGDAMKSLSIYYSADPSVFQKRLYLETSMVTTNSAALALYLVQGSNWFVSCDGLVQAKQQAACSAVSGVLGGEVQFFKSASFK
ncbi:hypothetical protein [Tsukamurella columbiensis]|uniref:DUF3558 domain-containing protein n=1 Tax=Tsukamurella columbiensis TaxID=128509 RepID=A0ABX1LJL0_9ACTN|nr:hypothetical protein [Tsukamurella columbiensis]NMD58481.1 hypothetical protein [Tsukamurella columbiensis]